MKFKHIILGIAAVAALSSCNDLLDIPQHGVQNYDNFYKTDEEAENAVIACYIQQKGMEYNYLMGKNMATDDFWAGGGGRNDNAELEQVNEFTFSTEQSFLQGMFQSYYQLIYDANVVLGHVPDETEVQKRARAEAKVFRAWAYFELISMWGNPPLVDHELEASEYSRPNGTTEELWALVEKDLTEAIDSGVLTEKKNADDKTWRITKQYAQAILGKAYLWQKKYAESAAILDEIVKSDKYRLFNDYENIYVMGGQQCCENLFESIKIADESNVFNNFSMTHLMIHYRVDKMTCPSGWATTGWGFLCPQKSLYEDFVAVEGENGYRLNSTIKTYEQLKELGFAINNGVQIVNEGYFMWKWRVTEDRTPAAGYGWVDDNSPRWMRYAEVLLCAAEAHLMNGNQGKADEYINMLRTRAQAPTSAGYTLSDIQREKRIELCGEGTRFQDMVRWGIAEERMKNQGATNPYLDSNGNVEYKSFNSDPSKYGFKPKHNLFPYPGVEIRLNPNITQNPGW